MAEAIAGDLLDEYGLSAVIISAGTLGISGRQPARSTREVLTEIDIEPPSTRSQGLSPALLERADYIPVMEPKHARAVADAAPKARDRIVHLWEYADRPLEGISDPVGEDLETFRQTRDLLYQCLERWFADLTDA
jgi:protein-tyrosine-phosphatase